MKDKLSRREALELGLGAVALGASGYAMSAVKTEPAQGQQEAKPMSTLAEFNKYGEELERSLMLRTSPIAVKMLEKEADIPKEAVRPEEGSQMSSRAVPGFCPIAAGRDDRSHVERRQLVPDRCHGLRIGQKAGICRKMDSPVRVLRAWEVYRHCLGAFEERQFHA